MNTPTTDAQGYPVAAFSRREGVTAVWTVCLKPGECYTVRFPHSDSYLDNRAMAIMQANAMTQPFTIESLSGLEWQQHVTRTTRNGVYNVDVTWSLDHYRIEVTRVDGDVLLRRCKAFRLRTAKDRANKLLRFWNAR